MFPYQYGNEPFGTPGGIGMGVVPIPFGDHGLRDLPEEIRAALEDRQREIQDEDDMRRLVNELMLRR